MEIKDVFLSVALAILSNTIYDKLKSSGYLDFAEK